MIFCKCLPPANSEKGAIQLIITWTLFLSIVFVVVPFFILGTVVPPDKIGVRQNYYSMLGLVKKGFAENGLEPGLHWKIPGISNIILLPRGFQFVHLKDTPEPGALFSAQSLEVPTTDGSKVHTDVTLVVRLFPAAVQGAHGGPKNLVESFTADPARQLRTFYRIAENELKKHLSELSTSDYYNPDLREPAALKATAAINNSVSKEGLQLWGSLIRRYVYADRDIDDQIFAKNLQEQTERLNATASSLSAAKATTEKTRAEWDANIKSLEVQGESRRNVIRSEADLYEATKRSEGDLKVATARAEVDSMKAGALSDIAGADVYVARELAPLVKTLSGGVVTGFDPYDADEWMDKLLGSSGKRLGQGR